MTRSVILGTGSYVPERVLTNADLEKMVDTSDQWIRARTGISERRVAKADEATSHLSIHAANQALEAAEVRAEDIDLIIVTTLTPDTMCPAAACWLRLWPSGGGCVHSRGHNEKSAPGFRRRHDAGDELGR